MARKSLFNEEELKYITENMDTKTTQEIAEYLKRSSTDVSKKINYLKSRGVGNTVDYKELHKKLSDSYKALKLEKEQLQNKLDCSNTRYAELLADIDKKTETAADMEIENSHSIIEDQKKQLKARDNIISDMRVKAEEQGRVIEGLRREGSDPLLEDTLSTQLKESVDKIKDLEDKNKKLECKYIEVRLEKDDLLNINMAQEKELDAYRLLNKVFGQGEKLNNALALNKAFIGATCKEVQGLRPLEEAKDAKK